jgi:hypothetical protein
MSSDNLDRIVNDTQKILDKWEKDNPFESPPEIQREAPEQEEGSILFILFCGILFIFACYLKFSQFVDYDPNYDPWELDKDPKIEVEKKLNDSEEFGIRPFTEQTQK